MDFESFLRLGVDSRDVNKASSNLNKMSDSADRAANRSDSMSRVASRAFGIVGAALSLNKIRGYTDEWTDLNSRVLNATKSQEMARQVIDAIGQTARRTYSSLSQTAESYLNNARTMTELGYATQKQLNFSDALNNSLVISGTKGEKSASVMNALSKALAFGELRGENFNTVIQSGGRMVEALATGLGTTTLELRGMAEKGLLTTGKVVDALTSQMEVLRKEAGDMPATIGDGFLLIDNAMRQFFGRLSDVTSAGSSVADTLISIADAIDEVSLSLASGQGEAYIKAWVSQWQGAAEDIANAMDYVNSIMASTSADASFNWSRAFLDMPANITAMVQIIAVEIGAIVDYAILYGGNVHKVFMATFDGVAEAAKTAGSVIWDNLNPISNSRDFMAEVTGAFTKPFDELTKKSQESADIIAESRKDSITWIMAERDAVIAASNDMRAAGDKLREGYEKSRGVFKETADVVGGVVDDKNEHQDAIDKTLKALDDEVKALEKGEIGWLAYQLQLQGAKPEEIEQAVAAKRRAIALRAVSAALDEVIDKSGLYSSKATEDANVVASAYSEMVNRIDQSFATAFRDIMDGSTSLFEGLLSGFKDTLANMAYEATIKPIMLNFQQSMAGNLTGGGQSGTSGATGAMGGMAAGGWMAVAAVAVIAAGSAWNKEQDKKFEKMTAAYRQGTQSTGTLLGDANKKSESIRESIETLQSIGASTLDINYGMYQALIAIREGIAGAAAGFAKSGIANNSMDITTGTTSMVDHSSFSPVRQTGDQIGHLADKMGNSVLSFGMNFMASLGDKITKELFKKKVTIADSGISIIGASLADILSGSMIEAFAYADVQTKKKIFGLTTSNKIKTHTEDMDEMFIDQLTGVFSNAGKALSDASLVLGIDFDAMVDQLIINPMKLSLKDLDSAGVTAEIEAFFSSTLDGFAKTLLFNTDALDKYQKIGEGAFETMIRLAGEANFMKESFDALRIPMPLLGMDLVDVAQNVISFAGGLDALQSSLSTYYDKFFTEQEKFETLFNRLTLATSGILDVLPTTIQGFRDIIAELDMTNEADQKTFSTLIGLSGSIYDYITALEKQDDALDSAADVINTAFDKLNKSAEAERARLEGILDVADTALGRLRSSVEAEQTKIDGEHRDRLAMLNAERTAAQELHRVHLDSINDQRSLVSANISALNSLANSLMDTVYDLSVQSAELDKSRWSSAANEVSSALASAREGRLPMDGELDRVLSALKSSQGDAFSSGFQEDFQTSVVQNELKELARFANDELTSQELVLASLDRQANNADTYYQRSLAKIDDQIAQATEFHQQQSEALWAIFNSAQADVDTLNGVDNTVLALSESIDRFNAALNDAIANDVVAELALIDDVIATAEEQRDLLLGIETGVMAFNASIENFSRVIAEANAEASKDEITELKTLVEEMRASREDAKLYEIKANAILEKLAYYSKMTYEEYVDARNRALIAAETEDA